MKLPHLRGYEIVYSGTTLDNYLTCAKIGPNDKVVFDKRKEPNHSNKRFYFTNDFNGAFIFGRSCARKTDSVPIIMEGKVPSYRSYSTSLDPGKLFVVDKIYLPKGGVDWNSINTSFLQPETALKVYFEENDPIKLLKK